VYIRVHCSTLVTMKTQKWNACFGEDERIIIIIIIIIMQRLTRHVPVIRMTNRRRNSVCYSAPGRRGEYCD